MEKVENRKLKEQALIERERRLDYWGFANPETLTSLEQQEATKYRIAEGAKAIETKLALAIERMEKRKEADLQRLTVRAAIVQATVAAPPKPVRGVVCGVASSDDTAMILIGNKIYNVGDTIDGVEITEIDLNEVEFERDGERWSQRLQEPADSRWKLLTP